MTNLTDYAIVITFFGLVIYWFGMFSSITHPYKSSKDDIYREGFLFFSQYFILPTFLFIAARYELDGEGYNSFLTYITEHWVWLCIMLAILIFIQVYPYVSYIMHNNESSYALIKSSRKQSFKHSWIIVALSYALIYITAALSMHALELDESTKSTTIYIYSALSIFFTFIIMTLVAIYNGIKNSRYLKVKVVLNDKSVKKGYILMKDSYVKLLCTSGKIIHINKDSIKFINEYEQVYKHNTDNIENKYKFKDLINSKICDNEKKVTR